MSVVRAVRDIELRDREALEHVLGRRLRDDERVVIDVLESSVEPAAEDDPRSDRSLPEWCDVYAGLSDAEVDEIDSAIMRSAGSREVE